MSGAGGRSGPTSPDRIHLPPVLVVRFPNQLSSLQRDHGMSCSLLPWLSLWTGSTEWDQRSFLKPWISFEWRTKGQIVIFLERMEQEQRIRTKSSFEALFLENIYFRIALSLRLCSVIIHINTAPNANMAHLRQKHSSSQRPNLLNNEALYILSPS